MITTAGAEAEHTAGLLTDEITNRMKLVRPSLDLERLSLLAVSSAPTTLTGKRVKGEHAELVRIDAIDTIAKIAPNIPDSEHAIMLISSMLYLASRDPSKKIREAASDALFQLLSCNAPAVLTSRQRDYIIDGLASLASEPDKDASRKGFLCLNTVANAITTPASWAVANTTIMSALDHGDAQQKEQALYLAYQLGLKAPYLKDPEDKSKKFTIAPYIVQLITQIKDSQSPLAGMAALAYKSVKEGKAVKEFDLSKIVPTSKIVPVAQPEKPPQKQGQKKQMTY